MLDYLGKSSDTDSSSPAEFLLSRSRWWILYLIEVALEILVSPLCLFDWFFFMLIPAERRWFTWFLRYIACIRIMISGNTVPFIASHCFMCLYFSQMVKGGLWVMLLSAFPVTWQPTIQSFFNYTGSVVKRFVYIMYLFLKGGLWVMLLSAFRATWQPTI